MSTVGQPLTQSERNARYYAAHRDEERERGRTKQRVIREAHRDDPEWQARQAAYKREWRARHAKEPLPPIGRKATMAANRAAKRFGERVPARVFATLQAQPCVFCGASPSGGVDHIIPLVQGGRNIVENLQPCCLPCNTRKAIRDRDERPSA